MGRSRLMALGALVLAACGGGGELADETMRRSAEQALDTAARDSARPMETSYRVPAFVDSPGTPADSARGDTATQPSAAPGWTSGVTERPNPRASGISVVRDLRVGRNEGFDRLVVDFGDAPVPAYRVEYAAPPVRQCGSGEAVALDGRGALVLRLRMTQAHDDQGRVTVRRTDIRAGMPVIRQASLICDFEGEVELALGVEATNPYRVLVEQAPNRLIVDVRH
jgi:hypothetical protein